ncbi:hypothetical protein D3C85_928080 [compost metagenome]
MVAVPCDTPVTNPVELTVATAVLLELQFTLLFVALLGETVAVNCVVDPAEIEAEVGLTLTLVTATGLPVAQLKVTADEAGTE